jgi:HEPN domain-containing protein
MTIEEHINYWIDSAEHDLSTAEALLETGKYDWSLFMGHLVLEKVLKALFVKGNENKIPPKIHNLVRLSEIALLELDSETKIFFDRVNDFNLEVRYPEYKNEFYKLCTKELAVENLIKIKESFSWIKSLLK